MVPLATGGCPTSGQAQPAASDGGAVNNGIWIPLREGKRWHWVAIKHEQRAGCSDVPEKIPEHWQDGSLAWKPMHNLVCHLHVGHSLWTYLSPQWCLPFLHMIWHHCLALSSSGEKNKNCVTAPWHVNMITKTLINKNYGGSEWLNEGGTVSAIVPDTCAFLKKSTEGCWLRDITAVASCNTSAIIANIFLLWMS